MTELSFLLELLLNHKLVKSTKDLIASRIKEVEANLPRSTIQTYSTPFTATIPIPTPARVRDPNAQAPSMAAKVQALQEEKGLSVPIPTVAQVDPQPVAVVAQTPATAAALQARQTAIRIAASGVPEAGRTSPRKF